MAKLQKGVDINARLSGSSQALKDIGLEGEMKDLDTDRTGAKTEKPPKSKTKSLGEYTTSGTLENPKVADDLTSGEAPNYGPASSPETSCAKCKHYNKIDDKIGHCEMFNFTVESDYTCDSWEPRGKKAPSAFIRTKLRGL